VIYKVKVCQKCGQEYQPTGARHKYCTECGPVVEATKRRTRNAKWTKANPEKARASTAKWEKENPEKKRASVARWYKANPEKARARLARWRKENPEQKRASTAKWEKENPEKIAVRGSKRRAFKYANTPISEMLTSTEWLAILAEANGHCAYCDRIAKLTLDHVIPLSKGGKYSASNVVAACGHCNTSKGNKTLKEWTQVQTYA
jgi:5-methylcytosine-specific restriction endonuclease McrA